MIANEYIELIIIAVSAVFLFTLIYHLLPYKVWRNDKPKVVFFPKYIAGYQTSSETIREKLIQLKFVEKEPNVYVRGKIYGDFSAKAIKLKIKLDKDNNQILVSSMIFGIAFDTGDLWALTSEIIQE